MHMGVTMGDKELAPITVSRLTSPGLYFVSGVAGLALQVLPPGGRTSVLRATMGGRRRDMGLGGYRRGELFDKRRRLTAGGIRCRRHPEERRKVG